MIRLTTNFLGVFAVKDGKIINKTLFRGTPTELAGKLKSSLDSACREELDMLEQLIKTGSKKIAVDRPPRFYGKGLDVELVADSQAVGVFQICDELGLNRRNIGALLREVNIQLTREQLKVVEEDEVLLQAVSALDDLEEVSNKMVERLREWYSIHLPELNHLVENHETYVSLVKEVGLRKNYIARAKVTLDPAFRDRILSSVIDSMGAEFSEKDMQAVSSIASTLTEIYQTQKKIEEYINSLMQEIAPNISALVGPLLGARLIKMANGLKRMATLPSSTIQIIGAEDAFFRFLKTGKKPPKHGIIFQYPDIKNSPRDIRGKLARTLASKLSTAARVDAYKGEFIGDKLKASFEKRVKALKG